ncbi:hypothetical protein ES708_01009 [subsurface metagenome]
MKRYRYTQQQISFLRTGYQAMQIPGLTAAFNNRFGTAKTELAIKSALSNRKITCGRPVGNPTGTLISYTDEQARFIRDNYVSMGIRDLTGAFNARFKTTKTEQQLKSFTHNHRIKSGRTGCFEKGHRPANKGTKGLTGANVTSFQKGNVPPNRKPLGTERIETKQGYILVKVAQRNPYTRAYRPKHIVTWEAMHGPVLPGMVVAFRDGDNQNCDPGNLMLISRVELLRLNQHHYKDMPDKLKPSVLALARLEAKAGISLGDKGRRGKGCLAQEVLPL